MIEIKIRAWDEKHKKMLYGPTPDNPSSSWVLALPHKGLTFMQYTGLRDNKRKEIWEGDILACKTWSHLEMVYYDSTTAMYRCSSYKTKDDKITKIYPLHLVVRHGMLVEVIGNRYENPELCEVEG